MRWIIISLITFGAGGILYWGADSDGRWLLSTAGLTAIFLGGIASLAFNLITDVFEVARLRGILTGILDELQEGTGP